MKAVHVTEIKSACVTEFFITMLDASAFFLVCNTEKLMLLLWLLFEYLYTDQMNPFFRQGRCREKQDSARCSGSFRQTPKYLKGTCLAANECPGTFS
jgi:hypothetical protein